MELPKVFESSTESVYKFICTSGAALLVFSIWSMFTNVFDRELKIPLLNFEYSRLSREYADLEKAYLALEAQQNALNPRDVRHEQLDSLSLSRTNVMQSKQAKGEELSFKKMELRALRSLQTKYIVLSSAGAVCGSAFMVFGLYHWMRRVQAPEDWKRLREQASDKLNVLSLLAGAAADASVEEPSGAKLSRTLRAVSLCADRLSGYIDKLDEAEHAAKVRSAGEYLLAAAVRVDQISGQRSD